MNKHTHTLSTQCIYTQQIHIHTVLPRSSWPSIPHNRTHPSVALFNVVPPSHANLTSLPDLSILPTIQMGTPTLLPCLQHAPPPPRSSPHPKCPPPCHHLPFSCLHLTLLPCLSRSPRDDLLRLRLRLLELLLLRLRLRSRLDRLPLRASLLPAGDLLSSLQGMGMGSFRRARKARS